MPVQRSVTTALRVCVVVAMAGVLILLWAHRAALLDVFAPRVYP